MQIDLSTPALLFPAISLLMLAYTNRFLALASIIRALHKDYNETHNPALHAQIQNFRHRVVLIRSMQWFGVVSLLFCVVAMSFRLLELHTAAVIFFAGSLVAMAVSLILSILEIQMSTGALEIHLRDMETMGTSKVSSQETDDMPSQAP